MLPAPTRPGRLPEVGRPAPPLYGLAPGGRALMVLFLRHVGCPFAEATLRAARQLAEGDADAGWLVVSHASRQATDAWLERIGGAGELRVAIDEPRALYAAWGLGRTSFGHFAGRRSLAAVARLARSGIRNRPAFGTRWQRAGAFAVDAERIVRWRHVPEHAGDLPDLAAGRAAL